MFLAFLNLVVKICCANQWPDPDPGYQFRSEPGISTRIRTRVTNSDPNLGYQLRSGSRLPIQIRTWDINSDPDPGYQFISGPRISTRIRKDLDRTREVSLVMPLLDLSDQHYYRLFYSCRVTLLRCESGSVRIRQI